MKEYFVYILSNKPNGTLYIGVTNSLHRRIFEHKAGLVSGFSSKHHLKNLVYYESCYDIESAILREKQMKPWQRAWKIELIESTNPGWVDLSLSF